MTANFHAPIDAALAAEAEARNEARACFDTAGFWCAIGQIQIDIMSSEPVSQPSLREMLSQLQMEPQWKELTLSDLRRAMCQKVRRRS
jgi:hypothetical protein